MPDPYNDPEAKTVILYFKKTEIPHRICITFSGVTSDDYNGKFIYEYNIVRNTCAALSEKGKKDSWCAEKVIKAGTSFSLLAGFPGETAGVVWSSSDPAVAAVTQDGKVTAYSPGTAVIRATKNTVMPDAAAGIEEQAECLVTVTDPVPVTSVTLSRKNYELGIYNTKDITATVLPATAEQPLVWSSSDPNVVSITNTRNNGRTISVKGVSLGQVTLTAAAADGSGKKATCSVTVSGAVPQIESNVKSESIDYLYLEIGRPHAMKLVWNDNRKHWDDSTWSLSNANPADVATITPEGVVTGLKSGAVNVNASGYYGMVRRRVDFYVPVKSVALNLTSATVSMSDDANSLQLYAYVTSTIPGMTATGVYISDGPTVTWSVDPKYAQNLSVTTSGLVTAGSVPAKNVPVVGTVRAWNGYEKKLTCKVTVKDKNPLKGIKISKKSLSIGEGNTYTLTAATDPVNPDGDDGYIWSSSDETIVSVDRNGKITANKPGKATVTVMTKGTVTNRGKTTRPAASCAVTVTPSVTGISITNASLTEPNKLEKGKTLALKTAFVSSVADKKASTTLIWESSDESVATVTQKGSVKAISPGKATITATSADEKAAGVPPSVKVVIEVYSRVSKIAVDRSKLILGTSEGNCYGKVSIATLAPDDVTEASIRWETDGNGTKAALAPLPAGKCPALGNFAEPGQSVVTKGGEALAIKALQPGTVKITGITTDGSNKKVTVAVTIRGQVTGLSLKKLAGNNGLGQIESTGKDEYKSTLAPNGKLSLTPVIDINGLSGAAENPDEKKAYTDYKKYTDVSVSYRSSLPGVASVDKNGKISVNKDAQDGHKATIYVTTADGSKTVMIRITVKK